MLVLSIFVALLAIVQLLFFSHCSKINQNIKKIFDEILKNEGRFNDCKNRLDSHHVDIVRSEKKIEANSSDIYSLSMKLSTHIQETQKVVIELDNDSVVTEESLRAISDQAQATVELNERREKFALYRKQGMDIKSAGKAVGVSFPTAKRYEKWMLGNNK